MLPKFFLHVVLQSMLVVSVVVSASIVITLPGYTQSTLGSAEPGVEQIKPKNKTRIAVLDFAFASLGTGYSYSTWRGERASVGMSDMLTNQLVQDGSYILVERSRVEAVLKEQALAASGVIEPATAAQIGRLLGADAVVIGSITRFNLDSQSSNQSLNSIPLIGGFLGTGSNNKQASVQITARLVNTTTGEVIAAVEGKGQQSQKDGKLSIKGYSSRTDSNNDDALLTAAAEQAIDQVVPGLAQVSSKVSALAAPVAPTVSALVADVAGNQIIVNKGTRDGFKVGMTLSVERVTKEVKDPATGRLLRKVSSPIGQVQITEIDAQSAVAKVLKGQGFKVGDVVKADQ
jgi:curli biogenesis system outer membrane secretion channel CsgG